MTDIGVAEFVLDEALESVELVDAELLDLVVEAKPTPAVTVAPTANESEAPTATERGREADEVGRMADVCVVAVARPRVEVAYTATAFPTWRLSLSMPPATWHELSSSGIGYGTILFPHMPCTLVSSCLLPRVSKPLTFFARFLEVF